MILSFIDFIDKYKLKSKAISKIETYQVLKKMGLDEKVGIFLRDGNFSKKYCKLNLHPGKETHGVCFFKSCYFDSNGFSPPKRIPKYLKNKHGKCNYSEYQL